MTLRLSEVAVRKLLGHAPGKRRPRARRVPVPVRAVPCLVPVRLELPWPPLNNRYFRHVGSRTLLSRDARVYHRQAAKLILAQWPTGVLHPFTTRLTCTLWSHAPDHRRYDLDGVPKCICDTLQRAEVYLNDWQIDRLRVVRGAPVLGGVILVTLENCDEPPMPYCP